MITTKDLSSTSHLPLAKGLSQNQSGSQYSLQRLQIGCKKNEKEALWAPRRSCLSQTPRRRVRPDLGNPRYSSANLERVLEWSAIGIFRKGWFYCLKKNDVFCRCKQTLTWNERRRDYLGFASISHWMASHQFLPRENTNGNFFHHYCLRSSTMNIYESLNPKHNVNH